MALRGHLSMSKTPPRGKLPGRVKAPEDKLTPGRPRLQAPPDAADVIRQACATGATKQGVALALGVTRCVLTRWLDEDPELEEAFRQGREKERKTLHNVLYMAATQGGGRDALIAAMFLLKSRHGYVEGEKEAAGARVNINFQLPGARSMSDYVIEAEHANSGTQRLPAEGS